MDGWMDGRTDGWMDGMDRCNGRGNVVVMVFLSVSAFSSNRLHNATNNKNLAVHYTA